MGKRMCFKRNATVTNEYGGWRRRGVREEKRMTRMKISNCLFLEAWLRGTLFRSKIIGVHYIHSKYNLKCKNPEFNLLVLSTSPPMRQISTLEQLEPILH